MYPILIQRNPGGACAAPPLDLGDALLRPWAFDAHIVQYEGAVRRNKASVTPADPLLITLELYDFDNKSLPDVERAAWSEACLAKLPEGFIGYRTSGGFRALTLREEAFVVGTPEQWELWRAHHDGRGLALGAVIGAEHDAATNDAGRLFRLPLAKRDDGKPSYGRIYGSIGYAELAPVAVPLRRATSAADGDPETTLVARVLTAAGLGPDRCPWQHEHTGGAAGGTTVFLNEKDTYEIGTFRCAHTHCKGRGTEHVLEALGSFPAVKTLLEDWGYVEPRPAPEKKPEPKRGMLQLVHAAALAEPLGAVPWLVEGLDFAPGRPLVVSGLAGAGKTFGLQELALNVARGADVWGVFPSRQGAVLHVDVDQGRYATAQRYQHLASGLGVCLADLPIACAFFDFAISTKQGINPAAVTALQAACTGRALCIIDSLRGIASGLDEQDSAFGEVLQSLASISATTGCAFAVVAHSGHNQDRARGTSAINDRSGAMYQLTFVKGDGPEGGVVEWQQTKRSEFGEKFRAFSTTLNRTPHDDGTPRAVIRAQVTSKEESRPKEAEARHAIVSQMRTTVQASQAALVKLAKGVGLGTDKAQDLVQALVDERVLRRDRDGGQTWCYRLNGAYSTAPDEHDDLRFRLGSGEV